MLLQVPQMDSLFADPPMYTLYITASLFPETCAHLFLHKRMGTHQSGPVGLSSFDLFNCRSDTLVIGTLTPPQGQLADTY